MNTTMTVQELIDAKEKLEKELLKVGVLDILEKFYTATGLLPISIQIQHLDYYSMFGGNEQRMDTIQVELDRIEGL